MHYAKNKIVPKIVGLLAFGLLAIPTFAEEPSEHVANGISGTQISGYVSTSASWYLYPRPQVLMPLPTTGNVYFSTESFRALYPYPGPESSFAQQLAGSGGYYGIGVNANARMGDGDSHGQFSLNSVSAGVSSDASRFELSVAAVPEPNVLALLGLGVGAVVARLRKKRNG
jgi:hypothetical protein